MTHNPAGTEGFEFLEFATKNPQRLIAQLTAMGFQPTAKHKTRDVTLYQQNNIRFLVNVTSKTMAAAFADIHGTSVSAMGFRVKDAEKALQQAVAAGAKAYIADAEEQVYAIPAIYGVGNSLIYFVDYRQDQPNYWNDFTPLKTKEVQPAVGLTYLDHVTHNLYRGNMDKWAEFYENIFNFKEIRYFDIEGKVTGLKSRAMTSPCGKIRIPLNESADDKSQIEEFLHDYHGEGIQHIALGTDDIYHSVKQLRANRIEFLDTPDTYYEMLEKRLPRHGEDIAQLQEYKILMDGKTEPERKLLLQIFTKNMMGPVFYEIIQRKGDEGFGEGNFRALFESIELDQVRRGKLPDFRK